MQRDVVSHSHFCLKNCGTYSIPHVNNRIILDVGAVADSDVVHVASYRAIAPNRGLFSELDVSDHLGTRVNECSGVDLRMDATKGSYHDSGDSNTVIGEPGAGRPIADCRLPSGNCQCRLTR